MNIILFSGKAEAGKTTAAVELKDLLTEAGARAAIIPYGAYVKHTAKLIFDWNGAKDEKGRQLLQHWGTDVVRAKDNAFWINRVVELASFAENELDFIIIDDCRFPNEIDVWKRSSMNVLSVRIERPGHSNLLTEAQRCHPSETSLDTYIFDKTISAVDLVELRLSVYQLFLDIFKLGWIEEKRLISLARQKET